ncbi:MAG: hypothetical protein O2794_04375 [bacterium]|nr:hypothetical protein [bacterium]
MSVLAVLAISLLLITQDVPRSEYPADCSEWNRFNGPAPITVQNPIAPQFKFKTVDLVYTQYTYPSNPNRYCTVLHWMSTGKILTTYTDKSDGTPQAWLRTDDGNYVYLNNGMIAYPTESFGIYDLTNGGVLFMTITLKSVVEPYKEVARTSFTVSLVRVLDS